MYRIQIQRATRETSAPSANDLRRYAKQVLTQKIPAAELTIRIVNEVEMTHLNSTYRGKQGTTNILSFPFDMPPELETEIPLIGDLVICAKVVKREAEEQHKAIDHHWAHLIVHGVLHLLGYNHEQDAEALVMEAEEIRILQTLNIANPYIMKEKGNTNE